MATITIEQRKQLNDILGNLRKANDFINNSNVIVSKNILGEQIPINKQIGSELCYLGNGIDKLYNFLNLLND